VTNTYARADSDSLYRSGRSPHWIKVKTRKGRQREAKDDWGSRHLLRPIAFRLWHQRLNIPMCSAALLKLPREAAELNSARKPTPYHEHVLIWPTAWPMEWQNWSFWQTVFDGPQAHGAGDGAHPLGLFL
jgi:hypothetical protein